MNKTLIVAAHPDDEVLGCGGTISKVVKQGGEVFVCVLGEGIASRREKGAGEVSKEIDKLKECSREACQILGVKDVFFHDLPDNRFDTVPLLDIIKIIEGVVSRVRPAVVYTHHNGDLNIDHAIACRATITATRPLASSSVRQVYTYEILSSTEWAFSNFKPSFSPNTFVDISDTLELKKKALLSYKSEIRDFPHPRSIEAVTTAAQRWGSVSGSVAAEAFTLVYDLK